MHKKRLLSRSISAFYRMEALLSWFRFFCIKRFCWKTATAT